MVLGWRRAVRHSLPIKMSMRPRGKASPLTVKITAARWRKAYIQTLPTGACEGDGKRRKSEQQCKLPR